MSVIKRNEQLEMAERQRVGKLVERVERIKQRASYYGPKNCRYVMSHVARVDLRNFAFFSLVPSSLCGQSFGFGILLNMKQTRQCSDCLKPVCSHCCVELSNSPSKKYETICQRQPHPLKRNFSFHISQEHNLPVPRLLRDTVCTLYNASCGI